MTPGEVLHNALSDGVFVAADGIGKLKITGDQEAVSKWLSIIRENKAAILTSLSSQKGKTRPAPCEGCHRFEVIGIQGADVPGCLYQAPGLYSDGWRRLPKSLEACLWH